MAANDGVQGLFSWYSEIPIVSRIYLTAAVGTTTACFLDFVSPLTLYYNYDLILRGQYWRLFSSFFFFGYFSLDFLFHLYFVVRYCRLLEEGNFRGRTPDFIFMIIFGGVLMLIFAVAIQTFSSRIRFLGVRMSLMGLFPFNAPYLPWVLLIFSLFLGNHIENDLLGILVGHIYYFFDSVYPCVAEIRGWRQKKIIVTPFILNYIFSDNRGDNIRVSNSL
jgi:Derlin-2/3